MDQSIMRQIPRIDDMLRDGRLTARTEHTPAALVKEALQQETSLARTMLLDGRRSTPPQAEELIAGALRRLEGDESITLRRVINATGVVLHTNLGRAVLSRRAAEAVHEIACGYSNLEYSLQEGRRGSRHAHAAGLVCRVTGAEDAMLVNNNAAAVLLVLTALAREKEVLLSRGELVEIGGAFRIPDIMEQSGARLREVGTTNRTRLSDYADAVTEHTGLLMKVHTSNYRIIGFTEETSVRELAGLKEKTGLPLVCDLGSGLLADLRGAGIDEPVVSASLRDGADLVLFSGDKLCGGGQAGIIAGRKDLIDRLKKHPLARPLRIDKLSLAAAEATLYAYLDPAGALQEIPVLRMASVSSAALRKEADELCAGLQRLGISGLHFCTEPVSDRLGGGSAPETELPGWAVTVEGEDPQLLEQKLRAGTVPVIATIAQGRLWLHVRTLCAGDSEEICSSFRRMYDGQE